MNVLQLKSREDKIEERPVEAKPPWIQRKQSSQLRKPLIGMEISPTAIRMARIEKTVGGQRLLLISEGRMPPGSITLSLRDKNIVDRESVQYAVQEAVDGLGGDCNRIGLSLPDEVVKIFIQEFQELPTRREKTHAFMLWGLEKKLRISMKDMQIAYQVLDRLKDGKKRVFIAICYRDVLKEYEDVLRELNVGAVVVRPVGINRLNFFGQKIPGKGIMGYYGLFGNYFTLAILKDGRLLYYQGVKSGAESSVFMYHMDMAVSHFKSVNPEKIMHRVLAAYEGEDNPSLHEWLCDLVGSRVERIRGESLINVDRTTEKWMARYPSGMTDRTEVCRNLSGFAGAMGAAQSLLG